jgi:hypothetical protein
MENIRQGWLLLILLILIPFPNLAQVPPYLIARGKHSKQTTSPPIALPQIALPQTAKPTPTPTAKPTATKPGKSDDDDDEDRDNDDEAEGKIPKVQQNPFKDPEIDKVISGQIDQDLWTALRGGLPCLDVSRSCLEQLQAKAIAYSPLLKEIDARLAEAIDKTETAKKANQKSIRLEIFTPALQYLLNTSGTVDANGHKPGFFQRLGGLFTGKLSIINDLLGVIGIPLFNSFNGGSSETTTKVIQVSDLQVRIAELQRARAELADKVKEKVTQLLTEFDDARVEYQMSQVIIRRSVLRFQLYQARYLNGDITTEEFLQKQNDLDKSKTEVYTKWAKLRRDLLTIKLLILTQKEDEN